MLNNNDKMVTSENAEVGEQWLVPALHVFFANFELVAHDYLIPIKGGENGQASINEEVCNRVLEFDHYCLYNISREHKLPPFKVNIYDFKFDSGDDELFYKVYDLLTYDPKGIEQDDYLVTRTEEGYHLEHYRNWLPQKDIDAHKHEDKKRAEVIDKWKKQNRNCTDREFEIFKEAMFLERECTQKILRNIMLTNKINKKFLRKTKKWMD